MSLSDKITTMGTHDDVSALEVEDVKEFIKELKKDIASECGGVFFMDKIDKLAGEKLI